MAMLKGVILKNVDRSIITDETVGPDNDYTVKKKKVKKAKVAGKPKVESKIKEPVDKFMKVD